MMQLAGLVFLLLGVFTKFGAILATIPDPIVGGLLTVSCAMVGGVGLSSVQMIDLKLSRNIAILGLAIIFGIMVPSYIDKYPIDTGRPFPLRFSCFFSNNTNTVFDQVSNS